MTPDYPEPIAAEGHVAPVPRRIRAMLGGRTVLDTNRAIYVFEWPPYPQYYVPLDDVAPDVLVEEGEARRKRGKVRRLGLRAGDVERSGAGDHYVEADDARLVGMVRFDWKALDAWFEEDEQVFVHPRNPYSRCDPIRSRRHVRVELADTVLADTEAAVIVFETGLPPRFYFPRTDVDFAHLVPSDTVTECPYKGRTSAYWSIETGGELHADLAWSYDFPTRELLPVAGMVAFYDEKVDTFLDGAPRERPRTHFFRD
jgi:uncharacterized protein (DUF427 family)